MKLTAALALALLLSPLAANGAELRGTVVKVDKAKNEIVVKTERGEQTLAIVNDSKGVEHAKNGAKVTVKVDDKNGSSKVAEIVPSR